MLTQVMMHGTTINNEDKRILNHKKMPIFNQFL